MSISDRLDQIEARADAATEGPWDWEATNPSMAGAKWNLRIAGKPGIRLAVSEYQHGPDNAEFIAHARTDVPALVGAIRAVLDLHRPMTMYEHEDCCENDSDDHREERHAEDVNHGGEFFCMDLPTGIVLCAECSRDLDFDGRDYPCLTVRTVTAALGEDS